MPAPYNSLPGKVEDALVARISLIAGDVLGPNVALRAGVTEETYQEPSVVCICDGSSSEAIYQTGNWEMTARIQICTSMDEAPKATHNARVANVVDAVVVDDPTVLAVGQTDFTCFNISQNGWSEQIEDRTWVTEVVLNLVCCPSTIT